MTHAASNGEKNTRTIDTNSAQFVTFYDDAPLWSARFGALLLDNIELRRDMRVMDLGCGTGFPLFELANSLGNTCRVTGVDIWEPALAHAAAKCQFYGVEHVDLVKANGAELPFANDSFDLIVSNLGLNNFEKPYETMRECARILKKNGRLALTTVLGFADKSHALSLEAEGAKTFSHMSQLLPLLDA